MGVKRSTVIRVLLLLSLLHAGSARPPPQGDRDTHIPYTEETTKTWCIPKPSLTDQKLQHIISYACNRVNCSSFDDAGGPCYEPLNAFSSAASAMNEYYQHHHDHQCFGDDGLISLTHPSDGNCHFAGRETVVSSSEAKNTWCVAKPTATDSQLQLNIDNSCSHVNCSVIEPGGECQLQYTMMNHASVAMNLLYQSSGRTDSSCSTGMTVITDPSYGSCVYNLAVTASLRTNSTEKKGRSEATNSTKKKGMRYRSKAGTAAKTSKSLEVPYLIDIIGASYALKLLIVLVGGAVYLIVNRRRRQTPPTPAAMGNPNGNGLRGAPAAVAVDIPMDIDQLGTVAPAGNPMDILPADREPTAPPLPDGYRMGQYQCGELLAS